MAIEVKKYKNTGLEYIQGSTKVLFRQGGVIAKVQDFIDWDRKGIVMQQVLGLANSPEFSGFDFDHAAKTGALQRKGKPVPADVEISSPPIPAARPPLRNTAPSMTKILAGVAEEEPEAGPMPEPVTAEEPAVPAAAQPPQDKPAERAPEEQKKKAVHTVHSSPLMMLAVIVIVGLGSLVMSAYHITTYMHDGGRAWAIAVTTGLIMTLFSAIAFTAARHFWMTGKGPNRALAGAFVLFGVIVIAFAMFATIKVNYDQFKSGEEVKIEAVVSKSSAVKAATAKEELAASESARLLKVIEENNALVAKYRPLYDAETSLGKEGNQSLRWQYYNTYTKAAKAAEAATKERAPYLAVIMNTDGGAATVEEKVIQEAREATVYGMFAKLFGIAEDLLKFIVYVIPAVFYDLMSPFALTVGMMLYEERKHEEEENA
jgi:hypothetical protein